MMTDLDYQLDFMEIGEIYPQVCVGRHFQRGLTQERRIILNVAGTNAEAVGPGSNQKGKRRKPDITDMLSVSWFPRSKLSASSGLPTVTDLQQRAKINNSSHKFCM